MTNSQSSLLDIQECHSVLSQDVSDVSLDSLRTCIDQVDSSLLALMDLRLQLASKVGEVKRLHDGQKEGLIMRPSREAQIILKQLDRSKGRYPKQAVFTLWRMLISSACLKEQDITILTRGSADVLREKDVYFGSFFPEKHEDQLIQRFQAVMHAPSHVALFSYDELNAESMQKLIDLSIVYGLHIVLNLPFMPSGDVRQFLGLAYLNPEPSGCDESVFCLELNSTNAADRQAVESVLADGFSVVWAQDQFMMITIPEYVDRTEKTRMQELFESCWDYVDSCHYLGAYPVFHSGEPA